MVDHLPRLINYSGLQRPDRVGTRVRAPGGHSTTAPGASRQGPGAVVGLRRTHHLPLVPSGSNGTRTRHLDRSVCVRRTERHRHGARRSRLRGEAPGSSVAAGSRRAHHHHGWLVHRAFGLGTVCGGAVLRTRVVRPPRPCRHVCLPTRSLSRGPGSATGTGAAGAAAPLPARRGGRRRWGTRHRPSSAAAGGDGSGELPMRA